MKEELQDRGISRLFGTPAFVWIAYLLGVVGGGRGHAAVIAEFTMRGQV